MGIITLYEYVQEPVFFHVEGNKVFRYLIEYDQFTLLYDLDSNVGDTISTFGYTTAGEVCDTNGRSRVDSVGLKMINGESLQYIYLSNIPGSLVDYDGYIFERIGAITGFPRASSICDAFVSHHNLRCYEDATFFYQNPDHTEACDFYVGINEIEKQSLEIYPNPNEGFFTISLPNNERSIITIYNTLGTQVYRHNEISGNRYEVDISELPKGIYMILLETKDGRFSQKVVKE